MILYTPCPGCLLIERAWIVGDRHVVPVPDTEALAEEMDDSSSRRSTHQPSKRPRPRRPWVSSERSPGTSEKHGQRQSFHIAGASRGQIYASTLAPPLPPLQTHDPHRIDASARGTIRDCEVVTRHKILKEKLQMDAK